MSETAKTRAGGYQIDLYSPVDTDPHKWQVSVTIPALCDFRSAAISFGLMFSAPLPLRVLPTFFDNDVFSKRTGEKLGTITGCAIDRWNSGGFPTDVGIHDNLRIFDEEFTTDNGYGMQVPMHLYVGLHVSRQLYFGEEAEKSWQRINGEAEVPIPPVISMIGLVGWVAPLLDAD
jgi:hypothetical protein